MIERQSKATERMDVLPRRDFSKLLLGSTLLPASFYAGSKLQASEKLPTLKKNVVLISVNLGFLPQNFTPDGDHLNSRYLTKFSAVHEKMTIFNDIEQPERLGGHRNHHSVFTCQSKFDKKHTPFVSLDQLIAANVEQTTRKKFITASTGRGGGMSFNMNGLSVPSLGSPDELYEFLFATTRSLKDLETKKKVLATFQDLLVPAQSDMHYRHVLEESAKVLESDLKWARLKPAEVDYAFKSTRNQILDLSLYLDLIGLGLKKKQANIAVLSIAHNGAVPLPGVTQGYHANSHHNNEASKLHELGLIEDYVTDQLANFLIQLQSDDLLDDTIVVMAGNMGDPSLHTMKDMSVILAGGGFKHTKGRVPCKERKGGKDKGQLVRPLANLYTSILHQAGLAHLDDFAGIKGDMDDILL